VALPNEENKKNINDLAKEAGQNTPTTPLGAAEIGAPSKSADMMGTPLQRKANLEMQQKAQKQRIEEQEKQASAEQQRLEGTTLQQAQRYQSPAQEASTQQQQAQELSESLRAFGPVQTRVQALIQERITAAQQGAAGLEVNEAAISALDEGTQDAARAAIDGYIKSPTEENLQKIYDAVGYAIEDISSLFAGDEQAIKTAVKDVISEKAATLESLGLDQLGIDAAQQTDLEGELGLEPGGLANLTLEDLNAKIAEVEAREFSEIERLQAILSDPTASASLKQQARDQLAQMGVVGVTGVEERVDTIMEQVEQGNTIEILGREFTLEQALSDEGLTDLIVKAVNNEELLQDMLDSEEYKDLGEWIQNNIDTLKETVEESEEQAESFIEVQDNYQGFRKSLGEGEKETAALEALFPGFDFGNSVLSADWDTLQKMSKVNPLYDLVKTDVFFKNAIVKGGKDLIDGFISGFLGEDYQSLVEAAIEVDADGNPTEAALDAQEKLKTFKAGVERSIDFTKNFEEYEILKDIYGKDALGENGYILDPNSLPNADDWQVFKDIQKEKPKIFDEVGLYVKEADKYNFGKNAAEIFANLKLLYDITGSGTFSDADKRDEIYADLNSQLAQRQELEKLGISEDSAAADIIKYLFKRSDFDHRDLSAALATMDETSKQHVLDIFDSDGDDKISAEELADTDSEKDVYQNLVAKFGLDKNAASIIGEGGAFEDFNDLLTKIQSGGVEKNKWAKSAVTEMQLIASKGDGLSAKISSKDGVAAFRGTYKGDMANVEDGIPTLDRVRDLQANVEEYVGELKTSVDRAWPVSDREWFNNKIKEFKWHHPYEFEEWVVIGKEEDGSEIRVKQTVKIPAINYNLVKALNVKTTELVGSDGKFDMAKIDKMYNNLNKLRRQTAQRYSYLVSGRGNKPGNWRTQKDDLMKYIEPAIDRALEQIRNLRNDAGFKKARNSYVNTSNYYNAYTSAKTEIDNLVGDFPGEGATNDTITAYADKVLSNPLAVQLLSSSQIKMLNKYKTPEVKEEL